MKNTKRIKSGLGVLIVILSLGLGAMLIFKDNPEPKQPQKPKPALTGGSNLVVRIQPTGPNGTVIIQKTKCPSKNNRCPALEGLTGQDLKVKEGAVCSQEYGGPSIARVQGKLNGETVSATLSVRNGCEIALWNRLAEPLGLPRSESKEVTPIS